MNAVISLISKRFLKHLPKLPQLCLGLPLHMILKKRERGRKREEEREGKGEERKSERKKKERKGKGSQPSAQTSKIIFCIIVATFDMRMQRLLVTTNLVNNRHSLHQSMAYLRSSRTTWVSDRDSSTHTTCEISRGT